MDQQRCCSLQLGKELQKKDYGFFVKLLLGAGIKAEEIQQIDLKGKRGYCKLTLSDSAALRHLVSQDIVVNGTHLVFLIGDGSVTSLQVFGVDADLPLSSLGKSLEAFGSVLGEPRREAKTIEGCTFYTCERGMQGKFKPATCVVRHRMRRKHALTVKRTLRE